MTRVRRYVRQKAESGTNQRRWSYRDYLYTLVLLGVVLVELRFRWDGKVPPFPYLLFVADDNKTHAVQDKNQTQTTLSKLATAPTNDQGSPPVVSSGVPSSALPKMLVNHPMRIHWLHIPKQGTSLFVPLYRRFCPRSFDRQLLRAQQELLKERGFPTTVVQIEKKKVFQAIHHFQHEEPAWNECLPNVTFHKHGSFAYHWPYRAEFDASANVWVFAMLRHPLQRMWSAYRHRSHKGIPMFSQHKNPISFEEYLAEPHLQNCQLKMVLGKACQASIKPRDGLLNVTLAVHRMAQAHVWFGLTDRWTDSMCLFHAWVDGSTATEPYELQNYRPGKQDVILDDINDVTLPSSYDPDLSFYSEAVKIFDRRLEEAGCV